MLNWNKLEIEYWKSLRTQAPNLRFSNEYRAFELGLAFKKLTPNQQRDFDFFLTNARLEKCYPNHFCSSPKYLYKPKSVEEWYYLWDTHGYSDTKELLQPNVADCEGIKQAKEFINLTIKTWVESCLEFPAAFDFEGCRNAYPMTWVYKAFINQLKRACIDKDGFITSFITDKII